MKRTHDEANGSSRKPVRTPRGKYKLYGDPENVGMSYPQSTASRLSHPNDNRNENVGEIHQQELGQQRDVQPSSEEEEEYERTSDEGSRRAASFGDRHNLRKEESMQPNRENSDEAESHTESDTEHGNLEEKSAFQRNLGKGDSRQGYERINEGYRTDQEISDETESYTESDTEHVNLEERSAFRSNLGKGDSRQGYERNNEGNRTDCEMAGIQRITNNDRPDNTNISGDEERREHDGDKETDVSDEESVADDRHPPDNYASDNVDSSSDDSESENQDDVIRDNVQQQQDPPPPNAPLPPITHQNDFLRKKLLGEFASKIEDKVIASRGEILLNIQELCRQHPLPLTAQEDLHKLINSIFYKSIVPETTYKLDKLYSSSYGVKYFFYCCNCLENFGELDYKTNKFHMCPECETNNAIGDLTKAHYFVIVDFINQLQLILDDPHIASQLKAPNEFEDNGDIIKDLHDAEMYKEFVASLDFNNGTHYISLTACTDGTPLYDSSTLSIWPIFVIVNEFPPKIRMSNVLLAGLWFGRKHPSMDLFLEPFCDFIRNLSIRGFKLNFSGDLRLYKAYLLAICVDSGARGSVQCIHSHNGAYGCNWCLHPGQTEGGGSNARKFLQLPQEPELRSAQQMIADGQAVLELRRKDSHINGVLGLSPLLRCPKFDIVNGMVLDNLHWASFGVGRRMGKLWLGETKKPKKKKKENINENGAEQPVLPAYYVGTDETKIVLNRRINKIRPPKEVRRVPRDFSQVHDFNAREWENMILYFSVPIFKGILPERFLKHWILFVQAFYLLMKYEITRTEIGVAGNLMKSYVNQVKDLYGEKELSFNMHISNHAEENAMRWGNGWSVSTYAFENGNKILKSKINAERGIPHQIIRSLERECSLSVLRKHASTPQSKSFRDSMARNQIKKCFYAGAITCIRPSMFCPSREEKWLCDQSNVNTSDFLECKRIIVEGVCYSVDNGKSRTDNSYALCESGIVKIRKIISSEVSGIVYLFVSKVRVQPYVMPRNYLVGNSSPFMYTVDLVEQGVMLKDSKSLQTICVNIPIDCQFFKGHFICVMANTRNVN